MKKLRTLLTTAMVIALSTLGLSAASAAGSAAGHCTGTPRSTAAPAAHHAAPSAPAARAAAPPVTVWMAGDSTMMIPHSSTSCPVGWGSQFAPLFHSNVTVKDMAVGGRSIQTWLYDPNVTSTKGSDGECVISPRTYSSRWQAMLDPTTGIKAGDYLFIQFGINDSDPSCPRHVGTARYQQLMTMMAQAALARGAHPVLLTAVAAITCSGSTATRNRGFVSQTFASAAATGAPVIDLQTLSVSLYNSLHFCPNNGDFTSGPVGQFFCNDHTHFETYGARQIARLVAGDVRRQNLPLATSLL